MMAAEPVMVPVFVVGLAQLPASILALPDMDATVMLPDTWAQLARERARRATRARRARPSV